MFCISNCKKYKSYKYFKLFLPRLTYFESLYSCFELAEVYSRSIVLSEDKIMSKTLIQYLLSTALPCLRLRLYTSLN